MTNKIWYFSYGSNLLIERFKYYITGGTYKTNNRTYIGCKDKSWPLINKAKIIHHNMYFAKNSVSWGGGGVCFIDPLPDLNITTYGRMYLVTREQFEDIWYQEGKIWYNKKINLGQENNIDIMTFTNSNILKATIPHESYLNVIRKGLNEAYPKLSDIIINQYLSY